MLRERRNDLFHLLNILESIGKIEKYIGDIANADEFINSNDQLNYNATLTLLANVAESLSKLSDETQSELIGIDFSSIRGMRNRIVHDYAGLNSFIVFDVAKNKLQEIKIISEQIINRNIKNGNFEKEEYHISVENSFYKHVRFNKINTAS